MGRCRVDVGWMWGRCGVHVGSLLFSLLLLPTSDSSWEFLEIENKKIKTVRNNSYG